jgi:DNA modification methylase
VDAAGKNRGFIYTMNKKHELHQGDALTVLKTLPDESIHCCVTSPPYWGLRDYGCDGQIGLEQTPEAYVARMVEVFREVRRVLREDGTCWVNLGDSYCGGNTGNQSNVGQRYGKDGKGHIFRRDGKYAESIGLKPKDLVGVPWRVAFALQLDGWWLRQDIIWHKPNPMPESVRDRCTKAHEYVFLLTKSARYYYDAEAVREDSNGTWNSKKGFGGDSKKSQGDKFLRTQGSGTYHEDAEKSGRNRRSVWTITTKPYSGAHFAVMPQDLVEPCIKAGCPEGGIVLDPFAGSGTTLYVANKLGRLAIGIELNPQYITLAEQRLNNLKPNLF